MSKYETKFNASDLLEKLNTQGFVTDTKEFSSFVIKQNQKEELSLYLRALVGVGASIASLCFLLFLTDIRIIGDDRDFIIFGLIFVVSAIGLKKMADRGDTIKHSFFMQSSFISMAVGKINFGCFGASDMVDSSWGITLALLVVTLITYPVYRMSIDRFLSSFVVLVSTTLNILSEFNGEKALLFDGFFLFQLVVVAVLLTQGKIKRDYIPLSYALIFSICVSVLLLSFPNSYCCLESELQYIGMFIPKFIHIVLVGGLIGLFGWVAGGLNKLKLQPLIVASIGVIILGFISSPGILLAIGLMVLGYATHEKLLVIGGGVFMPVFLFIYYYNMDISLLEKSGILIGSGIVLLSGRVYLQYKGWDKGEGLPCVRK